MSGFRRAAAVSVRTARGVAGVLGALALTGLLISMLALSEAAPDGVAVVLIVTAVLAFAVMALGWGLQPFTRWGDRLLHGYGPAIFGVAMVILIAYASGLPEPLRPVAAVVLFLLAAAVVAARVRQPTRLPTLRPDGRLLAYGSPFRVLAMLSAYVLLIAGAWVVLRWLGPIGVLLVVPLILLLAGLAGWSLLPVVQRRPLLSADRQGLRQRASLPAWQVDWADVDTITVTAVNRQPSLLLVMADPDYVRRRFSGWRWRTLRWGHPGARSGILIVQLHLVEADRAELLAGLQCLHAAARSSA